VRLDRITLNFDLLARPGLSANHITFAIKLEINFIAGERSLIYHVQLHFFVGRCVLVVFLQRFESIPQVMGDFSIS